MIKFKIFKNESDMRTYSLDNREHYDAGEPRVIEYEVSHYSPTYLRLLYDHWADHSEPPFRDPESLKILQVCGIELLEDHWYSMMVPNPYGDTEKNRLPLSEADTDLQYALTLLHYSREGIYLSYKSIEKKIWQVLSEMPFDILVAVWGEEINRCFQHFPDEFLIVNYPYCGTEIEVHGKWHIDEEDSFFIRLELTEEEGADTSIGFHNPECGLYLGKDGLYYTDIFAMGSALEYHWPNDLKDVIHYFDTHYPARKQQKKLAQISNIYSITEFHELLSSVQPDISDCLLICVDKPEFLPDLPVILEDFVIISHLTVMPKEPCDKYPKVIVIEKQADGTVTIDERYAGKHPDMEEMLAEALEMRKEGSELFCLFMDWERRRDVTDFDSILFGARVRWGSLELFDADDARQIFVAEVKEIAPSE